MKIIRVLVYEAEDPEVLRRHLEHRNLKRIAPPGQTPGYTIREVFVDQATVEGFLGEGVADADLQAAQALLVEEEVRALALATPVARVVRVGAATPSIMFEGAPAQRLDLSCGHAQLASARQALAIGDLVPCASCPPPRRIPLTSFGPTAPAPVAPVWPAAIPPGTPMFVMDSITDAQAARLEAVADNRRRRVIRVGPRFSSSILAGVGRRVTLSCEHSQIIEADRCPVVGDDVPDCAICRQVEERHRLNIGLMQDPAHAQRQELIAAECAEARAVRDAEEAREEAKPDPYLREVVRVESNTGRGSSKRWTQYLSCGHVATVRGGRHPPPALAVWCGTCAAGACFAGEDDPLEESPTDG